MYVCMGCVAIAHTHSVHGADYGFFRWFSDCNSVDVLIYANSFCAYQ